MIQVVNELFQFFSCQARLYAKFGSSGDRFRIQRVKSETQWLLGHMPDAGGKAGGLDIAATLFKNNNNNKNPTNSKNLVPVEYVLKSRKWRFSGVGNL